MAGELVRIVAHVQAAMRHYFDGEGEPLGGRTGPIRHYAGALVPLDGFPEEGVSWEQTDCPSLAFVNVLRRWRTTQFPAESAEVKPCGGQRAVLLQVGVARCAATIDDDGAPPPAEVTEREALVMQDDADRMEAAICRATRAAEDEDLIDASVLHAWEPVGPEGGIVTGLLTVSYLIA